MNDYKRFFKTIKVLTLIVGLMVTFSYNWAQLTDGREDNPHSMFIKKIITERKKKDTEFKISPTSPMAAVQRLEAKLEPGQLLFVEEVNRTVRLTNDDTDQVVFVLKERDGKLLWEPKLLAIICRDGNTPIKSGMEVPAGALFQGGQCNIKVYPLEKSVLLIVFDSQSKKVNHFEKLLYYPPDEKYAVAATLEKFDKMETVTMGTSQKKNKTYYRYASIRFNLDGKEYRLSAFKSALKGEEANMLFIPFGDATNGKGSYEVGRFLEIEEPKTAQFTLDFNLCFNPLCNYSNAYNCPIPPMENIITAEIKAGEMTYPH